MHVYIEYFKTVTESRDPNQKTEMIYVTLMAMIYNQFFEWLLSQKA